MSVTISDILALPSLRGAKIAAGKEGLSHIISSISVLESINTAALGFDFPGCSNNYGKEIIITAFIESKDDVQQQCYTLQRLQREGEVGVIVFYVGSVVPALDQQLLDLADELQMPLIVMPECRLELRYSDVISEVMEAIINDRRENNYFATEVIERISHMEASQRSINRILAIIRDRIHCSIYLVDELGRILNTAEWPNGRYLPIDALQTELSRRGSGFCVVEQIEVDEASFYVEQEIIQNAEANLHIITVKETGDLSLDCCKQVKYILKTYINLWTENYGRLDAKQLVSAIINDEPEKMQRIAHILHINVSDLSCAYFFYSKEEDHNFSHLREAKNLISGYLSAYKNTFLSDIFDETIVVFSDKRLERIDKDLPALLGELEQRGLSYSVLVNDTADTTQAVKESYWVYQKYKDLLPLVFPEKYIITASELLVVKQAKDGGALGTVKTLDAMMQNCFFDQRREDDLANTLEVYLLDSNMSLSKTAELMFVHKNTIKYRLKNIEDLLGHRLNRMPDLFHLYVSAAARRLNRSV